MNLEAFGSEIKLLRKGKKCGFIEEVGIKKVEIILDLLGYEFFLREKGRPKILEELQDERR